MYGTGNVNHKPDTFFVVRRSCKSASDQEEMDWFDLVSQEAPLLLTLTSIYLDYKAYNIWNEQTWVTASGKRKTISSLRRNPNTGKFPVGRQGNLISCELARKRSLPFKRLGTVADDSRKQLFWISITKKLARIKSEADYRTCPLK
ncbi:hypothetical protein [Porphyromonas macacae]|uniref:hypothetical protein n=1 Tax=Porphyromonas macacae TaxID=28115 RepID=UPI0011C06209|nr:hypothetical protein [Porphyromonas macacae]